MRKTSNIKQALRLKGLSDSQIKFSKLWRFSNIVYTEDQLKKFSLQQDLEKDDKDYALLFEENGISEFSMKFYASKYSESLMCDNKIDAVFARELVGKYSEAIEDLDVVIEDEPNVAIRYYNRGRYKRF